MEPEIMEKMIEALKARAKTLFGMDKDAQANYLVGAMQMYLTLKPESEDDGTWCPPSWVIDIMRGRDFTKD